MSLFSAQRSLVPSPEDIPVTAPAGLVVGLNVAEYGSAVLAVVRSLREVRFRLRSSLFHVPTGSGSVSLESAAIRYGQHGAAYTSGTITTTPTAPTGAAYYPAVMSGITALAWYQSFETPWVVVRAEEWALAPAQEHAAFWSAQVVLVLNASAAATIWTEATIWEVETRDFTGQYPSLAA